MLGEIFTPGLDPDASYTGATGDSAFSIQYYRNKAREFQAVLNSLDTVAGAAQSAVDIDASDSLTADLQAMLADFDAKKAVFRTTAEAINLGAASINAMGGRFPQLSVPSGLGIVPIVVPVAIIAAIGTAAALITWGVQWIDGVNRRLSDAQLLGEIADPDKRDAVAAQLATSRSAAAAAQESPLASIANIVKWGAIALGAYLAFQAFQGSRNA